jgi:hypothetical protein
MCYQVAYCDSKFWACEPLENQVEQTFRWYVLECPAIGIADFVTARRRATNIKARFGARAQVVLFGLVKGQYVRRDADSVQGITVLQGANAAECKAPIIVFGKGKKPVFYSTLEDLGIGKPW